MGIFADNCFNEFDENRRSFERTFSFACILGNQSENKTLQQKKNRKKNIHFPSAPSLNIQSFFLCIHLPSPTVTFVFIYNLPMLEVFRTMLFLCVSFSRRSFYFLHFMLLSFVSVWKRMKNEKSFIYMQVNFLYINFTITGCKPAAAFTVAHTSTSSHIYMCSLRNALHEGMI